MTHRTALSLAATLALCLTLPAAGAAQDLATAQRLLDDGNSVAAAAMADILMTADPDDAAALIVAAQAARDLEQPDATIALASRAFRTAPDDTTRYVAARLVAIGHAALDQDTRAQFWLRRARQLAPDAANAQSVAEDYAFLRDRNPLSVDLNFGISPSSNINNGSRADRVRIGQFETILSESAKPLSGLQYDAGVALRYRLTATETEATFATFDLRTTTYTLSTDARDGLQRDFDATQDLGLPTGDLPRDGSDFAYTTASVGLVHNRIFRLGAAPTRLSLTLGHSWYGGDPYQTSVTFGAGQAFATSERQQFRLDLTLRQDITADTFREVIAVGGDGVARERIAGRDVASAGLALSYARVVGQDHLLSVSATHRISRSDASERDFTAWQVGAGFDLATPVLGTRFGFGLQLEERVFGDSIFVARERRDRTVTAQVAGLLDAVEVYGFNPAVTIAVGRTLSEAARFDTEFATLGFDLRSAF
ncbi:hypothetical protein SAMN04488003_14310 [Loktanella fryxellensis]|uniref:Tetratricopeptide repeat-containing protein n=1 Tax=Loktanella fryxellensis TaxID=245187 RepID=A0A1H8JTY0_9RHOB|nr:hypothetical protein [Loktanella fryxellensis]SEN84204.1 hypothetical protein SAMN04488003_14310 [Loktanella fryxellensis]